MGAPEPTYGFLKPTEFVSGPLTMDEMMKILSLLENPKEAEGVRKALRFYEAPVQERYEWGKLNDLMAMLNGYASPLDLKGVLPLIAGAKSVLEIGSGFGGALKVMASVMPKGATVVAVENGSAEVPSFLNQKASLKETCRQLGMLGASVQLFLGDSHSPKVVNAVEAYAPFDFILLDGDRDMKADWENYGPMGKVVAFAGINGNKAWDEVKASGVHTEEVGAVGIVYRE